jgi:eukaryotic-like serine/threonine-protein kinase
MQGPRDYLAGLAQIDAIEGADERRRVWRQGLASLAMAASNQRAAPLEALRPDRLLASVQVAFRTGLVDDVKWMSPGLAAAAFFEIASALPGGDEKRDLGRRVLEALLTGDAATFALLATSLASASRRGLSTPPVRSRVALAMRLPIGIETGVDRLALALLCRPDLERGWLSGPSSSSLPARRVAARLLERAAREAVRRGLEGDDVGLKTLRRAPVRAAFARLLADRESLVWRHVASARGLLAAVDGAVTEEIEKGLSPQLGPTEWRRAVTSLAASVAHAPTSAVTRCQDLLQGPLFARDPGLAAGLIFGLSRAATVEPEAVEALLPLLLESGDLECLEAFVDLLAEHPGWRQAGRPVSLALEKLRAAPHTDDDGLLALRKILDAELSPLGAGRRASLRQQIIAAQMAFVEGRDLRPHAEAALATAGLGLGLLERLTDATSEERQRGFQILRELDRGLLESSLLADMLVVSGIEPSSRGPGDLGDLITRLRTWLLNREAPRSATGAARAVPEAATEITRRQLRALVHAIDGEGFALWDESVGATRERRLRTVDRLLERLAPPAPALSDVRRDLRQQQPDPMRRPICAALARACEGLVRDELAEIGELILLMSARLRSPEDFVILGEATLASELKDVYAAMAALLRVLQNAGRAPRGVAGVMQGFATLTEALPPGLSAPVEALRRSLVHISRLLERVVNARSLTALAVGPGAQSGAHSLDRLGESVQDLTELLLGVWRRMGQGGRPGGANPEAPASARALFRTLDAALVHAVRGTGDEVTRAVTEAIAGLHGDLPALLAEVIALGLTGIPRLPLEAMEPEAVPGASERDAGLQLPSWLPPSRVLGGFYVMRPIGRGTVGSVFVVCRAEERHEPTADRFALKIPYYDGSVAHTLSEEEFLRLFREEAGALLTLPTHPNLAAFVNFDARARPKPVLVMELVEGPTLERMLERRDLTLPLALGILDGVGAGLEAMHGMGIGHLDIKPANVILRAPPSMTDSAALPTDVSGLPPVLVDFGLAGRKVRPGCASPYYGAPEVWVTEGIGPRAEPPPADVYSYCCLAFELLVGRRLFTGDTLPAVVAAHFEHDGRPAALAILEEHPHLSPVAELLSTGLRADPRQRPAIRELRAELGRLAPGLRQGGWPVAA